MIEILKAILFGIVEDYRWLPISSTGHMILLNEIVSLNVSEEFYSMFEVVIQLWSDPCRCDSVLESDLAIWKEG